MKKYGVLLIILLLSSITLVLGQGFTGIENFIVQTGTALESIFRPIIGGETGDNFLFAKAAFFFITYILVYTGLTNTDIFGPNRGALFITSIIVAILSARYIPDVGVIRAMILPYQGFFTAVGLLGLPIFVVYVIHSLNLGSFFRRIILVAFFVTYLFYWTGNAYINQGFNTVDWIAALPLILFFMAFIVDNWIRQTLLAQQHEYAAYEIRQDSIQRELSKLDRAEKTGDERRTREVRNRLWRRYGVRA